MLCVSLVGSACAEQTNPLAKVLDLMEDLTVKVTADGEEADKAYNGYFEWCDDTAKEAGFQIKSGKNSKIKLTAKINEMDSNIEDCGTKIEELAGVIGQDENELKGAVAVRAKEHADFVAAEQEMDEAVGTLSRAIGALEKEMAKGGSFAQLEQSKNLPALLQALGAIVDAAGFSGSDKAKLVAMVQTHQADQDDDEDDDAGAPAAAVYKSKSGGIVDTLDDMKDKAEEQLGDLRKAESSAKHNYEMLNQGLLDAVSGNKKDMDEQKSKKSASQEAKGTAEKDFTNTEKDLKGAQELLTKTQSECIRSAADHETSLRGRKDELAVLAKAKKILQENTGDAEKNQNSFIQVSSSSKVRSRSDVARQNVLSVLHGLAKEQHSTALAQLASRVSAIMKYGSNADVFGKVKGLIGDMIAKLEKEASEEADEKAFCDEELAKTKPKNEDLADEVGKLTTGIEQAASRSASLKEEVKVLQEELASVARQQKDIDDVRTSENAAFSKSQAELQKGLSGVGGALDVLRDYYAKDEGESLLQDTATDFMHQPAPPQGHKKATGAGGGIIDILEIVESDFATNLAQIESEESVEVSSHEEATQENKITKTRKDQDVKYKTGEFKSLDNKIASLTSDRATVNGEKDAVGQYLRQLKNRCIAKPSTYEERAKRRTAEIAGLKQALEILESEAAFMQRSRRGLRGTLSTDK